jgi:exodeoxyribonuclease-1
LNDLRQLKAQELTSARPAFDDARLPELLWRYRARNFPQTLSADERARWEAHRSARLFDGEGGALTIDQLFEELDRLAESADERGEVILGALYDYAEMIAPQRA